MKTPRISVVMPAYNSEKYIGEAIESILNQTFTDFEFIIINDGSMDDTAKIVSQYANKDKRIKFINNKDNRGIVSVLNQGLDLAKGEYIARMDSDDISLSTRFERQIQYMESHPECGVLGTWFKCFGKSDKIIRNHECVKICNIVKVQHVGHPTVMLKRAVVDKYKFHYDEKYKYAEDFELWSRMVFVTEIHNLPEVLLKYRWHGNNISIEHAHRQQELTRQVQQNVLNKLTDDNAIQQMILHKPGSGIFLPKWFGRLCCLFIFSRHARHNFRAKYVRS